MEFKYLPDDIQAIAAGVLGKKLMDMDLHEKEPVEQLARNIARAFTVLYVRGEECSLLNGSDSACQ
ncbi:hypothetical protein LOE77_002815 [Salmonella enterica]|nr:hypothetical protein [Salmonella enterica]HCA3615503.1 hypothetical protein [Salmonella enterica subsp. diarizonae serovar 61:i:z]